MPLLDRVIIDSVEEVESKVEDHLDCDVLFYYGELRSSNFTFFRDSVERIAERDGKRNAIGLCLTTPGGQAEAVERMVEVIRHHYEAFYALVPNTAMSAGTIFCMAADRIYMDYSSALGPIDPQVPDRDNRVLVPALGYLDKVEELIQKSAENTISPAEFQMLQSLDLAMLRFYEQAKDLSINLLKKWLAEYKFKNWTHHRTTNPGSEVTPEERIERAREIATKLSDNNRWHSHGRMIGMGTLRSEMRLEIEDFSENAELHNAIRQYADTLTGYIERNGQNFVIFNRHLQ
ncbi:MAG: serine dehydrogenasease [Sphingomonadaceae bacterium]|nr:serine dehydrogenasease [Sphingomonadaceae bacterium]MBG74269.1 serine dehydrogenasease [Erythrobacteraceae bacterium]|tara:strand:- start:900 stop:1769 length:870 start_codon:yes stop_codon:yes gene_type:complete